MTTEANDANGQPIRIGALVHVAEALLDGKYRVAAYSGIVAEIRADWIHGHVLLLKCEDGTHCAAAGRCTVLLAESLDRARIEDIHRDATRTPRGRKEML